MTAGRLRAVVCTSSLDLGVDWGDIDLVINVGAPKGASRLLQRIGRANHRMDEPSRGVLVPANRFEVLECRAALGAVVDNAQDTPPARTGALDVLAQHVLGSRLRRAVPRRRTVRGGHERRALCRARARRFRRGARFRRHRRLRAEGLRALRQDQAGAGWPLARQPSDDRAALPHECRHHRRGRHAQGAAGALAGVEDDSARRAVARPGRGIFHRDAGAGRHFRLRRAKSSNTRRIVEDEVYVSRTTSEDPKVPAYEGGKFPLSTYLADRVRRFSPITIPGKRFQIRCANGSKSRNGVRSCRAGATFWSRPSHAPTSIISSAIRSKGASRTRRSACC